jgi:acetate---CoA ligase (ADP-forming)
MSTPPPSIEKRQLWYGRGQYSAKSERIVESSPDGYQSPETVHRLLDAAGIPRVKEIVAKSETEAVLAAMNIGFPVVMKVIGPLHKTEVGGVILNVRNVTQVRKEFHHLYGIQGAEGVMVAQMASGTELFLGANYEEKFGHIVVCGMGGIYVEVLKDVASGLAPLSHEEAISMIKKSEIVQNSERVSQTAGVNIPKFAEIVVRLSSLLRFATEIKELDINPLLGNEKEILAVDARVRIEKNA